MTKNKTIINNKQIMLLPIYVKIAKFMLVIYQDLISLAHIIPAADSICFWVPRVV